MKIHFSADDVRLDVTKDKHGKLAPSLAAARNGSVLVELTKAELESALLAFAQAGAAEQGAKVDSVDLTLTPRGERSVEASVRVKAKKSFVGVTVTVNGRAEVDERLTVTVSGLSAAGEGMLGPMVAGVLGAKLKEYEGRSFPLAGDALKNVRLREIRLDPGDPVRITAAFER